jgi:hypothetical protein
MYVAAYPITRNNGATAFDLKAITSRVMVMPTFTIQPIKNPSAARAAVFCAPGRIKAYAMYAVATIPMTPPITTDNEAVAPRISIVNAASVAVMTSCPTITRIANDAGERLPALMRRRLHPSRRTTKMPLRGPSVRQRVALKNQLNSGEKPARPEKAAHYTVRFAVLQEKENEHKPLNKMLCARAGGADVR